MASQSKSRVFKDTIKAMGGVSALLEKRASGLTWEKIAAEIGCSRQWLTYRFLGALRRRSETLKEAIALANREFAAALAEGGLDIIDGVAESKEAIAKAALQVSHRRWLAGVYDREVFGEQKQAVPLSPVSIGELHIQALIQAPQQQKQLPSGPSDPVAVEQPAAPVSEE